MNWTTVYVRGKVNFEREVLHQLQHSGFRFMPGFLNEKGLALFWIDESSTVRDFKKAIGSKAVFKYRLHFFTTIDEFVESKYNPKAQPRDEDFMIPPLPAL